MTANGEKMEPFLRIGDRKDSRMMGFAKHEHRRVTYEGRIFLLLLLVAMVPVLIVGMISYSIYMEEVTKQSDLSMEAMETQIFSDVEGVLSNMRQYYLESSSKDEISWLIQTRGTPYKEFSDLDAAQKVLKGPTYLSEYVNNYAFINLKLDWVLTNNGMYPFSEIRNMEQVEDFLKKIEENPSTLYWYNNLDSPSPFSNGLYQSNTLDVSGFQMIMKLPGTSRRMDQLMLVQLNLATLTQKLRKGLAGYDVSIFSQSGKLFFDTNETLTAYLKEHQELREGSGTKKISVPGLGDFRIRVQESANTGMTYVTAYNLNQVREGADRILEFSLELMIVLFALLGVCWILTKILYKPVRNLASYVSESVGKQDTAGDELALIRENVGLLVDSRENLQEMVQRQQRLLLEQFFVRAIRGELTPEAIAKGQEQFQMRGGRYYRLLAAICMLDSETNSDSGLESEALSMMIVQKLPSSFTDLLVAPPFSYSDQFFLIIGAETVEALQEKTQRIYAELASYIEKEFGCGILSGVSQVFTRLKYLRTAYNECTEMLRNTGSESHEHGEVTFYEDIAREDGIISGYDFVLENSLTKAVNNGESQEAAQLVDKFVNSLNNRGISRHDRSFYIYRMIISVLSVLSDAGLTANQVFAEREEDLFQKIHFICESDKLKHYLNSKIVQPAIEALKQYRYKASSDILKNIMELVRETKGDITLTECAEQLNYHPSYIWKVLKAERNMTFTDLVNYEKLETAKQMLLETDCPIAEIAEKLNYSNTQNFIRFFSKYAQTTPGKYRKEHQNSAK